MRLTLTALTFASMALAAPVLAQDAPTGDAAAGAKVFAKCQTCHVIADADGNVLGGKNAKTGPNLYGLPGRTAGSFAGFNGYGKDIVALGEGGFAWNEADFVEYVADPSKFLKARVGGSARSKMSFKLNKEADARNVWAYIASLSPAPEAATEGEAAPATN